jgi:glycosyltransferase involved in cell wall biosynthesis
MVICDAFFGFNSAANQMRDLCECLEKSGHDITVLTIASQNENVSFCETITFRKLLPESSYTQRLVNEMLYSLQGFVTLFINRKLSGYDIIVWYSPSIFWGPLIWFLRKRNPNATGLLILRDVFPHWAIDLGVIKNKIVSVALKIVAFFQYQQSHRILIQSPGNTVYFEDDKKLLEKVEYFPNWLNSTPAAINQYDLFGHLPKKKKIIIYSGSLGIAQGYKVAEYLINFCSSSKDYGILFVGKGKNFNRLAKSFQGSSHASFLAEVNEQEVVSLYHKCAYGLVLLDPSHRSQNIPGKFIGYIRENLPVILSVNLNNDLRSVVKCNDLGVDISCCSFDCSYEELQFRLDEFLRLNGGSQQFRRYFEKEHRVEIACERLMSGLNSC